MRKLLTLWFNLFLAVNIFAQLPQDITLSSPITADTEVQAMRKITLGPGFHVPEGITFKARIDNSIFLELLRNGNNLTVSAVGGDGTFTYEWSTGETGTSISTDGKGIYSIKVTDGLGQQAVETYDFGSTTYNNFNHNYVKTEIPLVSGISSSSTLASLNESDKVTSYRYHDGLGRPIQIVSVQTSPMQKDIVQHIEYDQLGRQVREYLPYSVGSQNGAFREEAGTEQRNFHFVASDIANSVYPYSERVFDDSPLNRVMEQGSPGADWQPLDASITNSGHTVKYNYLANTTSDGVKKWSVDNTGTCNYAGTYTANSLYKYETVDENGNPVLQFMDKLGNTILKKTNDGANDLLTYYVYDDFDRLRYVFPPKAVDAIGTSTVTKTDFSELIYYYEYDEKGRMCIKKIPGAKEVYMIYDKRDRLAVIQDGNLRDKDRWMFVKYDSQNRPVITGTFKDASSGVDDLQSILDAEISLYEVFTYVSGGVHGYSNSCYPTQNADGSDFEVLTVTYYDSYNYQSLTGYPDLSFDNVNNVDTYEDRSEEINGYYDNVIGQVTGTKVLVLDNSADPNWLYSASYYDDRGRVIQSVSTNYTGGMDIVSMEYDFVGKIMSTRHEQSVDFGSVETMVEYTYNTYDHVGRLLKTEHQLGDDAANKTTLASIEYNENGQVKEKNIAEDASGKAQQSIDYTYNIRGWLTSMNNPGTEGIEEGDDFADIFGMELYFNDPLTELGQIDTDKHYNGNIAGVKWSHGDGDIKAYAYQYDDMNRLLAADYGSKNSNWVNEEFDVLGRNGGAGIEYDKNGNIMGLGRKDDKGDWLHNFQYRYNGNKLMALGLGGGTAPGTDDYDYDDNGNMISDNIKGLNVKYNYLNLPQQIDYGTGDSIVYIYDAGGRKLAQDVYVGGTLNRTTDYVGNIIYKDGSLQYLLTNEGKVNKVGTDMVYEYHIKDHLGNVRVAFEANVSGPTVTQEADFYPFGLRFAGSLNNDNKYLYNGKEIQEGIDKDGDGNYDLQLDWYDFEIRMYNPEIARWNVIDPMADERIELSPYNYCSLNPINRIDPNGMLDDWIERENGVIEWDENVTSATDKDLKPGDRYLGKEGYGIDPETGKALHYKSDGTITEGTFEIGEATITGTMSDHARTMSNPVVMGVHSAQQDFIDHPVTKGTVNTLVFVATGGIEGLIEIGGLTGRLIAKKAVKSSTKMARTLGKEGEKAVGTLGAKTRIPSLTGTAKYRIPDKLTSTTLTEVKNVKSLSLTRQLKDFNIYSMQNGLQFQLYTRPTTTFSAPLKSLIDQGSIIVKTIPGL